MKVKIIKAKLPTCWYSTRIGEVFEVLDRICKLDGEKNYQVKDCITALIKVDDAVEMDKEKVVFT